MHKPSFFYGHVIKSFSLTKLIQTCYLIIWLYSEFNIDSIKSYGSITCSHEIKIRVHTSENFYLMLYFTKHVQY